MDLVLNNPYRHLGLLVGASTKEQSKQVNKLKMYLEAEQEPDLDFSFPSLGKLNRSVESVTTAAANLTLDSDKMLAAMFWFYKGNPITDEPVFDAIIDSDLGQVMDIWEKLTSSLVVTKKNASAFNNYSTLYLSGIQDGTRMPGDILKMGMSLKLIFLDSEYWIELKNIASGQTFHTTKEELQIEFLRAIETEVRNKDFIDTSFIQIVNSLEFTAKERYLNEYIAQPIAEIQSRIDSTKAKRKADKSKADHYGEALYSDCNSNAQVLKSTFGTSNHKVSSIFDKLADEILQCGIDYFNDCKKKNSNTDYAENAIRLAKQAQTIAEGKLTKDRIRDNIVALLEIKDKEIQEAIDLLKSVKLAFEDNCRKIDNQVFQQLDMIQRMTLDYDRIGKLKRNSIDWNKVNELLKKQFTDENIEKIRNCTNSSKKQIFIESAEWILEKSKYPSTIKKVLKKYDGKKRDIENDYECSKWYNNPKDFDDFTDWMQSNDLRINPLAIPILYPIIFIAFCLYYSTVFIAKKKFRIIAFLILLISICTFFIFIFFQNYQTELKYWENTKITKKWNNYLTRYPKGKFIYEAEKNFDEELWIISKKDQAYQMYLNISKLHTYDNEAETLLEKFKMEKEAKLWDTDTKAWEIATKRNIPSSFKKYLALYPNGEHFSQAKKMAIDKEVDSIMAGNYGSLPSMDKISYGKGKKTTISINNNTSYTLTLRYSGKESKIINIFSNDSKSITLPNGSYRIAASVNATNVRDFAGTEALTGGKYDVKYYIQSSRY